MDLRHKALFGLAGLFGITLAASIYLAEPEIDNTPPAEELPRQVGDWQGLIPLFCQQEDCLFSLQVSNSMTTNSLCPKCGGKLSRISLAERKQLPSGTKIKKMTYQKGSQKIFVSMVITGHERSSIHRPQWCLPGQGLSIQKTQVITLKTHGGRNFRVSVLDTVPEKRIYGGGLFAYWFADKNHETPLHRQRLFWMAYNDLILGVRRPWIYVSIWCPGEIRESTHIRLENFLKDFYDAFHGKDNYNNHLILPVAAESSHDP
jgi:hypothetical protein